MGIVYGHGWSRAEEELYVPGDRSRPDPQGDRDLMPRAPRWDQEEARAALRRQVLDHLASPDGVLVLLEAEFIKESSGYVGTQRHADYDLGRIEHRQTGVFLAYAGPQGEGYLDRELFLPRCWTEREKLRLAAGMPPQVTYATLPQMARRMLERALEAEVPHGCIVGGATFGADAGLRLWLEERQESYLLGIPGREVIRVGSTSLRADAVVSVWPKEAWLPAPESGAAARGEAWGSIQVRSSVPTGWERWLVARRLTWDSGATDLYLAFVREGSALEQISRATESARRTAINLREARRVGGLDRFSGRSWEAWYRHMTVTLMAHALRNIVSRPHPTMKPGWETH